MKLRIKGNSIRLRLGQSEVRRIASNATVEESTAFGPSREHRLIYSICASPDHHGVSAAFTGQRLAIYVPRNQIQRWATTEQIGIEAVQQNGDDNELRILIEKDFECTEATPGESQEDAFPHPQFNAACPAGKRD